MPYPAVKVLGLLLPALGSPSSLRSAQSACTPQSFVSLGPNGVPGMTQCQGDCDAHSDCAPGLKCKQRSYGEPVPGCHGWSHPQEDYCYDPSCDTGAPAPAPAPVPPPAETDACLCVFDIDRTLTGKQGTAGSICPANQEVPGVWDAAYAGGWLALSAAGQGLQQTFCNECYLGVISAGTASGPNSAERSYFLEHVLLSKPFRRLSRLAAQATQWSENGKVLSPLVLGWPDRQKQVALADIIAWYASQGITTSKVNFFGDRTENIAAFEGTGLNAKEVSCASRDMSAQNGMIGLCGATIAA